MSEYRLESFTGPLETLARLLRPDDDQALVIRDLAWKIERNPHGRGRVFALRQDAEVAALVCMFPRRMLLGDRERMGALNADLVVNPAHRRKGLAVHVLKEAFAGSFDAGYFAAFGFPNTISMPAQRQAGGWCELGTMQQAWATPNTVHTFVRRAAARVGGSAGSALGALAELALRPRGAPPERAGAWRVDATVPSAAEYDAFWARVRARGGWMAVRDHAWHRWRFHEKPDYSCGLHYARSDQGLEGYLALAYRSDARGLVTCFVLDVLAVDPARRTDLLALAPALARRRSAVYVVFPFIGPVAPTIWPGGRVTDTGQIVFVRSFDPDRSTEKIGTEQPWLFTFADSDAV